MIEKRIHLDLDPENTFVLDPTTQVGISKTAGVSDSMQAEIQKILQHPDPNYTYLLVNALGAGEYWGPNSWGDYFSEKDLIKSFNTFFSAHVFRQHKNFNPKLSIGDVLYAEYNPDMHRVELIIRVRKDLAPDVVADIEKGKLPDVSMGCRVKYDVCSICGNKAPTRAQYCDHAKNHMNEVLPDGRKVFVYNPDPKFFDISIVRKGADRTAKTLKKIASDPEVHTIAVKSAEHKQADIDKQIPAQDVKPLQDYFSALADPGNPDGNTFKYVLHMYIDSKPDITPELLYVSRRVPWQDILQALEELQIPLKSNELNALIPDEILNLDPRMRLQAMRPTPTYYPGKYASLFLPFVERSVNPFFMEFLAPPSSGGVKEAALGPIEAQKLSMYLDKLWHAPAAIAAQIIWILALALMNNNRQADIENKVNQAKANNPQAGNYIDELMAISRAVQQGAMVPVSVHSDAVNVKMSSAPISEYVKLAGKVYNQLTPEDRSTLLSLCTLDPQYTWELQKEAGLGGKALKAGFKYLGVPLAGYSLGALPGSLAQRDIKVRKMYGMAPTKTDVLLRNTAPALGAIGALSVTKKGRGLMKGLVKAEHAVRYGIGNLARRRLHLPPL